MVQRNAKGNNEEPEQKKFEMPSQKEHLFQVVEVYDQRNSPGKMELDADTVCAKLEVCGGDEEGRTMLNRMTLDDDGKGFWATKLFLKSICEPYKCEEGKKFPIDTDNWAGKQFYATVVYNKGFANIKEYNFDKMVEQSVPATGDNKEKTKDAIAWDE